MISTPWRVYRTYVRAKFHECPCVCARMCVCVYPSHTRGTVIIGSPGQITPVHPLQKRPPWPPWQRVFALRHFATLLSFVLAFPSLCLVIISNDEHDETRTIKHDENRIESFFRNFPVYFRVSFSSLHEKREEKYILLVVSSAKSNSSKGLAI